MNDLKVTARITNELEMKTTNDGRSVMNFGLAIARENKNASQDTDFINATAFGKTAELIYQYMDKGLKGLFMGKICSDRYEKDGKTIYTNYMLIEKVEFIEYKKSEQSASVSTMIDDGTVNISSDDLPF